MNENGAVWFLVFPVVGEFDGTPVGNVALFAFSEYSVEHSSCTKQTDMAAMKRRERSAAHAALFAKEYPAGLAVGCRRRQEVFNFIQWNARVGQNGWLRAGHFISGLRVVGQDRKIVPGREPFEISCSIHQY